MNNKPNRAGLDPTQLAHLRQQLLAGLTVLRTRRSGQLAAHKSGVAEVEDEADQAFRAGDEETLSVLTESERERIAEIEHALEKLDLGEYGLDEETDEPIGFARLSAVPWARFAVTTQENHERKG